MAPEVAVAGRVTTTMNVWALGCTVVEMVTGKRPWRGLEEEDVMARVADGRHPKIPAGLSAEGRDFLNECFVVNRLKRATANLRCKWGWVMGWVGFNHVAGYNDVAGRVLFLLGYIRLIRQFCLPHQHLTDFINGVGRRLTASD
ncbi:unnamed protein product [Linum tenue]|uniref:Protein kinase domain-containing protein n=1 Tax=Linum tenue TaxID=586396 RepID=A0AAV0PRM1_9ROSI|nr:unnamed protein product [Linum tenue]